jgi:TolB-like protein
MTRTFLATASILALLSAASLPSVAYADVAVAEQAQQQQAGYSVAILPFAFSGKSFEDQGQEVQTLMTAYMSANPDLMLVERAEVDKALSEVELGMSGTVDPETAARVGHLLGAQVLVTGRVFPVKNDIIMVAKVVGVETGRVYGATVTYPANGKLTDAVNELTQKVGADIVNKGTTLVAKASMSQNVVAALKPKLQGLTLPTVAIDIGETSINRETTSPAAQTEMAMLLQQLGFTVIDPSESNKKPDVKITGEAISEFALRKGNLVSAKGHVEIKAIKTSDGSVLLVDRENTVAVELAAESAGKKALAKGATALTKRFVEAIIAAPKK